MTWMQHHIESERLAGDAEITARHGDEIRAQELYALAGEAEVRALSDLDPTKLRTYGISAVSAVSLYYKAGQLQQAAHLAHGFMLTAGLAGFAAEELRGFLVSIWSDQARERANLEFAPGEVIVSVKGGEIIEGGAPLDLVIEKVKTVQSLFYRTTELLRGLPHRNRGGPTKDIIDSCRPWLFQTAPGSYQFAVAIQEPTQPKLFGDEASRPKEVAEKFLSVLRATVESPSEMLQDVVPDIEYQNTFLKLTRSLAPTGKTFGELGIRSVDGGQPITLFPSTRTVVNEAIRAKRTGQPGTPGEEKVLHGILRAVHLDKDWIEVIVDNQSQHIVQVGEVVDDLIDLMVNQLVNVTVFVDSSGKFQFRDIESDS